MPKENCDFNELFIEQFADRELDYLESAEVAAHLKSCEKCRRKYEAITETKKITSAFAENEKLSLIEKEGFLRLIDQKSEQRPTFIESIKNLFQNRAATLAFSFFSFSCLVFAFIFAIAGIEKENNVIIDEIMTAHSQALPDEFGNSAAAQEELKEKFKTVTFSGFTKRPKISGRFTSIAATPTAKITLDSNEDNIRGTLFLSKRNEQLEKLFSGSDCLVKKDDICKARHRSDSGKEMIYWQNSGNNYLMVSDESNAAAKMVKLINTNF
ncbi:zf-HC2 domain-containing protein [bacterium]|jgi:hypothetical protein|nr:zf-HC2 domain-containing protein [bacterium]